MAKAIKLYDSGLVETIDVPEDKSLSWYYNHIGCDMIEIVHAVGLETPYLMVVDEEALLKDHPVINCIASLLYDMPKHGCAICGTVLIMQDGMTEEGPDIIGIPDDKAEEIANEFREMRLFAVRSVMDVMARAAAQKNF